MIVRPCCDALCTVTRCRAVAAHEIGIGRSCEPTRKRGPALSLAVASVRAISAALAQLRQRSTCPSAAKINTPGWRRSIENVPGDAKSSTQSSPRSRSWV